MGTDISIPRFRNEPETDFADARERAHFEAALDDVRARLGRTYSLLIDGKPVDRDETFASVNPAHPDQIVGRHAVATADDVEAAVAAAERAFPIWSATSPEERADFLFEAANLLRQRRHEFAALMVLEVGKSWAEADGEAAEAVDLMEWYGRQMLRLGPPQRLTPYPGEDTAFFYVPLGVGAIISPWNFPLALTTGMMTAALVAGNTVVVKPSSASPTTVAWLVDLLHDVEVDCNIPEGAVNLITGPGGQIGDALVEHPRVRLIAFTGSKDVGVRIYERGSKVQPGQKWLKRIQLEMGGKNGVIVDETADLDAAAGGIVASAFGYQGQKCSAGSRAIVVDSVYRPVLQKVVEQASALKVGDPADPETDVGPVIDAGAERKILDYIDIGKREGELMLGGERLPRDGHFIAPTIFADVQPTARIAQEEIFGPVLAFIRARDFDHALEIANGTEYGLTGALFSSDEERLARARREFHVGNLYLNRKCTGAMMGVHPFGGFNMSGTDSKAGGPDYLLFYLQGKSIGRRLE
jgi:1-pyrroline-5-carboxylate dehydrogenase